MGAIKFLYGRGFRNPSPFQLFYSDGFATQGNPNARPEADTAEVDVERKLGRRMNVQASAYGYRLRDFLVGTALANGLIQYLNAGTIEARESNSKSTGVQRTGWRPLPAMQRSDPETTAAT